MLPNKKEHPKHKPGLHARNKHRERYNFKQLVSSFPPLSSFVKPNKFGDESIDFANAKAVLMLNKALLKHHYGIDYWHIPTGFLCPPIPGRADYIHHIADLLGKCNNGKKPKGNKVKCLDVGVGANCVYPIIGNKEYGWSFTGSDIEPKAIQSAQDIIDKNTQLNKTVRVLLQPDENHIFKGIIQKEDCFDITICNPPFHSSLVEAQAGNLRKLRNLNKKKITKSSLNFGGQYKELCYTGGERNFVEKMVTESKLYASSCFWFSTLISKESNLNGVYNTLNKVKAAEVKTIPMSQGNKTSRIIAWTFLTPAQQKDWVKRW